MTWREIIKEQFKDLATAIQVAQGKDPNIAKAILDDAEKKIKKDPNPKPDKAKDELYKVLNKVKKTPKAPLTPQEKMTLVKTESFSLRFNKTKYVKYSYTYPSANLVIKGVGEIEGNKIKKVGFEYFKKGEKSFKIVPKERTTDLKFRTQELSKEDFEYALESIKKFPLVKSVE